MSNFVESFQKAHQAHINWQKDRPLIDRFNHSDIQIALDLLSGEIAELNGGDDTGIFSHENIKDPVIKADYRQQEISDIIVFAVTAFDKLAVQVDLDEVEARANAWADGYDFKVVEPKDSKFPPPALTDRDDKTYEILKLKLNQEAAKIAAFSVEVDSQDELVKALESIIVYCVAMHSLLGVNSGKAVMEKIARNMIKYPAGSFKMPEGELTDDQLKVEYDEARAKGATNFDGPKMMIPVEGGEDIFDRPKTGTTEFYSLSDQTEKGKYEPGEMRRIGILYRAAAQVIASSYGFSVNVSNLLNRNK